MPLDWPQASERPMRPVRPITGRFVLLTCMAFFGVIFAVNAVMMTLAIRTMPGLDVANGYVASQAMNREISAMHRQTERGWTATVDARLAAGTAPISVSLADRAGNPISGLQVTARLAHPAMTRADQAGTLIEHRPGHYKVDLSQVHAGAWTLVIEASEGGERVFASRNRIILAEAEPEKLKQAHP